VRRYLDFALRFMSSKHVRRALWAIVVTVFLLDVFSFALFLEKKKGKPAYRGEDNGLTVPFTSKVPSSLECPTCPTSRPPDATVIPKSAVVTSITSHPTTTLFSYPDEVYLLTNGGYALVYHANKRTGMGETTVFRGDLQYKSCFPNSSSANDQTCQEASRIVKLWEPSTSSVKVEKEVIRTKDEKE